MKRRHCAAGPDTYRAQKAELYTRLIALRTRDELDWYDYEAFYRPLDQHPVMTEITVPDGQTYRLQGHFREAETAFSAQTVWRAAGTPQGASPRGRP